MALPYRRICLWLVSLFALGNVSASTGSLTGAFGFTATWTTTETTITITGTWSALHAGDQLLLFRPAYPTGAIDGGQVSSAGQHAVSWTYPITGESGNFQIVCYSTNGGQVDTYTTNVCSGTWTYDPSTEQTITIDPSEKPADVSDPVAFSANGGHNAYVWSVTPTTGCAIVPNGDTCGFEAGEPGTYSIHVYNEAGNGYAKSNTASATVYVATKGVTIKATNHASGSGVYSGSVRVTAGQTGGVLVTLMNLAPGDSGTHRIYKTNQGVFNSLYLDAGPVYIRITRLRAEGAEQAADSDIIGVVTAADATKDFKMFGFVIPQSGPIQPDPEPSTHPLPSAVATPTTPPPTTMPPPTPVVHAPPGPATPAGPVSTMPSAPVAPPVPGAGNSTTSTETVAGTAKVKTTTTKTEDENGNVSELNEVSTSNTNGSSGEQSASEISNMLPESTRAGSISVSKGEPDFTVSMPGKFGGKVFDLNPFRADRLGPVVDWFRLAVAWLCIVLYGIWISKEVGEWMKGVSTIRQAQGNTVVGGTGAQATALVAAAAITVAVSTFTVALIAWLSGDVVSISTMLQAIGLNPMSGVPSTVGWMLDRVFPIATMVTCLVARMSFNFYAAKIFAVAMTIIRWIVP